MGELIVPAIAAQIGITAAANPLAYALLQVGVGLGVSTLANSLLSSSGPSQTEDTRRDLAFPTALPPYRFVYGTARATGTVLPHPVVSGVGYGVYLLNSRPSVGTPTIYLDGREITLDAGDDIDDMTGSGASPSTGDLASHLQVWIGYGDQTTPPDDFVTEAAYNASTEPLGFRSTDAGQGLTIVYVRYAAGDPETRYERWPNVPPQLEVEGLRTAVYDSRDVGHDADDEDTWAGTSNAVLNALDVMRNNPFRPYDDQYIDYTLTETGADTCDETVALNAGGTEARYTVDGTVIFSGTELDDILTPLLEAADASLVRVGGKVAIVAGAYSEPVYTLSDVLGPFSFRNMMPGRELPTKMKTTYVSAARDFADAELELWDIPGVGVTEEPKTVTQNLPFTTSATRAMRLRKIRGLRAREQKRLTCTLPPAAMELMGRSGVTVALGSPWDGKIDGTYEVVDLHPMASPLGDGGGVALRIPATLRGASSTIYDWDETTDEETVTDPSYTPTIETFVDGASLGTPTIGTLTESPAGTVNIPVTAPNDLDVFGIEIYVGPDSDVANASQLEPIHYISANSTYTAVESGIGSAVTKYYFVRTIGYLGATGPWSAGSSITTA